MRKQENSNNGLFTKAFMGHNISFIQTENYLLFKTFRVYLWRLIFVLIFIGSIISFLPYFAVLGFSFHLLKYISYKKLNQKYIMWKYKHTLYTAT